MTVLAGRETRPGVTRAGPGEHRGRLGVLAAQTGRYALFRVAERELAGPEGI